MRRAEQSLECRRLVCAPGRVVLVRRKQGLLAGLRLQLNRLLQHGKRVVGNWPVGLGFDTRLRGCLLPGFRLGGLAR